MVLAEDVEQYTDAGEFASNAELRSRDELPRTLRELAQDPRRDGDDLRPGVRGRKAPQALARQLAEPTMRLVINEEVCEGCGDCVKQSNCMSLTPVVTELGQKMRIHQSSCNKDYSCALGDCPSFVTVKIEAGTGLRKKALPATCRPRRSPRRAIW